MENLKARKTHELSLGRQRTELPVTQGKLETTEVNSKSKEDRVSRVAKIIELLKIGKYGGLCIHHTEEAKVGQYGHHEKL